MQTKAPMMQTKYYFIASVAMLLNSGHYLSMKVFINIDGLVFWTIRKRDEARG